MTVPYTFGTATTSIPLSNLDSNFNTPITLGNTSIYLGNTTTTIGNLTLTNATISSGTVNITNVTVTTANVTNITVTGTANIATGNVTTLTSTSITDSGLTSGRVTYAGASGLLTDSANFTFSGTQLTVSSAIISNNNGLVSKGNDANLRFDDRSDSAKYWQWYATGGYANLYTATGITALTIDYSSGNVGIGVTPTTWTNGKAIEISGTNYGVIALEATNATSTFRNWALSSNYNNAGELNFIVGASQGAKPSTVVGTFDSSGRLGLGVTPNTWYSSNYKTLQIGTGSLFSQTNGSDIRLSSNAYLSTAPAWTYINGTADYATSYEQTGGEHRFFNAPSGTGAVTFTQAMTLNASGNLGIGTTSPSYLLEVKSDNSAGQGIKIWGYSSDGTKNSNLYFGDNAGTNSYVLRFVNTFGGATGETYGLNLRSLNTSADFNVMAGTEASPITGLTLKGNSGNVGIGTISPNASAILDVQSTTKGVRMPNMTTTQKNAISSPAAGLMVFDTTLAKLCVYSGSAWQTITSV